MSEDTKELEISEIQVGENTKVVFYYTVDQYTIFNDDGIPEDGYSVRVKVVCQTPETVTVIDDNSDKGFIF